MHLGLTWSRQLTEVQTEHQNGEGDLSDLKVGWLLVPDGPVRVFQKLLIYWDFHAQPSLGVTEKGQKKIKYPVSGSFVQEKALLLSEVRGEWAD